MKLRVLYGWLACAALVAGAAQPVCAGLGLPLRIGSTQAIRNEFGGLLTGTLTSTSGELVQVLQAADPALGNEGILPPDPDTGAPDPANPLVIGGTARIGQLVAPDIAGHFGISLESPKPGAGTRLFVRVYNAPTLQQSTFYVDSEIHQVKQAGEVDVFLVSSSQTDQPIDPRDDDGDGTNNSWERSWESLRAGADADGDGMSDGAEYVAGTDVNDAGSLLRVERQEAVGTQHVRLAWQSVPGKVYQVESIERLEDDQDVFRSIGEPVLATGRTTEVEITNGRSTPSHFYRVRLHLESNP